MTIYLVEEHDSDAGPHSSGISQRKYVRGISERQVQAYCRVNFGGWYWKAYPIEVLEVDIDGICDICGEPVTLGDPMCDSCYWNIREG